MRNIVLGISYDGTDYAGFQKQRELPTIQGVLEDKLKTILVEPIRVKGASRTDAGVHAREQVINFLTSSSIPRERFPRVLNDHLPPTIRVIWAKEADVNFHARFSAISRTYKYFVVNKESNYPFIARYALIHPEALDIQAMVEAGKNLIGVHDFSAFTSEKTNTIRNLINLDIMKKKDIIIFTLEANAFLKGMVRNIVGTLLLIGKKRLPINFVIEALEKRVDAKNLLVAPQGLFLWKVKYDNLMFKEE